MVDAPLGLETRGDSVHILAGAFGPAKGRTGSRPSHMRQGVEAGLWIERERRFGRPAGMHLGPNPPKTTIKQGTIERLLVDQVSTGDIDKAGRGFNQTDSTRVQYTSLL